jgi:hypothetical protein
MAFYNQGGRPMAAKKKGKKAKGKKKKAKKKGIGGGR